PAPGLHAARHCGGGGGGGAGWEGGERLWPGQPRLTQRVNQGAYELLVLLLGFVGLLAVGSSLLVLVLYLKFPRLRSPARLFLLHVGLGNLLPSVLRAALAFAFRPRGGVVGGATNCVWDGFSNSEFADGPENLNSDEQIISCAASRFH
uniref:Uncharacterized protein n=1 Tax=Phocoena sinus TaxID=42100 RepID=A0A8C9B096_PHOSS